MSNVAKFQGRQLISAEKGDIELDNAKDDEKQEEKYSYCNHCNHCNQYNKYKYNNGNKCVI